MSLLGLVGWTHNLDFYTFYTFLKLFILLLYFLYTFYTFLKVFANFWSKPLQMYRKSIKEQMRGLQG